MLFEKVYVNFVIYYFKLINRKVKYWGENGLIFVLNNVLLFVLNVYLVIGFFLLIWRFCVKLRCKKLIKENYRFY